MLVMALDNINIYNTQNLVLVTNRKQGYDRLVSCSAARLCIYNSDSMLSMRDDMSSLGIYLIRDYHRESRRSRLH